MSANGMDPAILEDVRASVARLVEQQAIVRPQTLAKELSARHRQESAADIVDVIVDEAISAGAALQLGDAA